MTARSHDATGVSLWQRCPRRFWFERVREARPAHGLCSFSAPLGIAAHAGLALALGDPAADAERVRARMLDTLQAEIVRSTPAGQEDLLGAFARLDREHLELVLRVRNDERVRKVEWTALERAVEWRDARGRRFAARVNAIGRVKEPIPGFGRQGERVVDLTPGTWIVVDWRFGRRTNVSPTNLALNLQLAFWLRALEQERGERFRAFVAAARDLVPPVIVKDEAGKTVPRQLEELNPEYLAALAGERPVDQDLVTEAEASRRRFARDGRPIPKRLRRQNPAWEALASRPRGPLFHEAEIAWPVVRPAIGRAVLEIEAAALSGREDAYPARGPETFACGTCPFRDRCLAGTASPAPAFERSA